MDTASSAWEFVRQGESSEVAGAHLPPLFYEDMVPDGRIESAPLVIDREELVRFAQTWDPLPFHVNEEAARKAFGGITAPGLYMLAIKQRLIHTLPPHQVIASLGYDEVRFHSPLRPGDTVRLKETWIERRVSSSKPDRGVVKIRFALVNQRDEVLMSHYDTVLVQRRIAGGS